MATQVTDDTGVPIEKSYLVRDVKGVESDIDSIIEGYEALDNGQLQPDDPGAAKLIAEQGAFEKMFGKLQGKFGDDLKTVEKAFSAYIQKIGERNNQILRYNAAVAMAARDLAAITDSKARIANLNELALSTMAPDLPFGRPP